MKSEIAKEIGVCWKSANRRLTELHKIDLVSKDSNGYWKVITTRKEVIVL